MDELSPLFHDIEFNERFRGYDVEEVDAYVDRVAKAAALVQGRIAELQERVAAAEAQPRTVVAASPAPPAELDDARLSRVLVLAQRTADAAIEEAKAEAEAMRIDASADAERMRREADDHASLVLAEAETDRRRMITEAEEAAAGAVAAERARVAAEVAELEQHRAVLSDDIAILEQHLAESRLTVAASLSTLSDLLEAPETFRAPIAPVTSGVEVPPDLLEGRPRPEAALAEPMVDVEPAVDVESPVDSEPAVEVETEPEAASETAGIDESFAPVPAAPDFAETVGVESAPETPEVTAGDDTLSTPADEVIELSNQPVEAPPAELESDGEPTQVFETIPFEPLVDEDFSPPVVDVTFDPAAPEVELAETSDVAAAEVASASAVDDVSVDPSDVEDVSVDDVSDPVVAITPEPAEAAVDEAATDEMAEAEPNRVFDIDLVDVEAPVVDLTDPQGDQPAAIEPDRRTDPGLPESSNGDGDGMTATAPPRLVTAEDIGSTDTGEWVEQLSEATAVTEEQDLLFAPPESTANDHFLDQLRDAVTTDDAEDFGEDALAAFFDDGEDGDSRGWFNRRR